MLKGPDSAGLPALVKSFQDNGLGHIVSSWISTGQNLPITQSQIEQVLGSGQIQQLAQKAGIPPDKAGAALAAVLPLIVDHLTPNGALAPQESPWAEGLTFLKNRLGS
jgi:uncharacterized protein YidB (DUF937 family)